jgi:CHAD domain-containing protein
MAYRIKLDQSPGKQLSRIVREQIDRAVEMVSQPRVPLAVRVHAARTAAKRIRAALRFVRGRRPKIWRAEQAFYRDAACQLAPLREAAVIPATVAQLREQARSAMPCDITALQRWTRVESRRILAKRAHNAGILRRFVRAMGGARRRLRPLKLDLRSADLLDGFRCSYRSARRAWARLGPKSSASHYHELRKRAKAHAYHCRLFRKAWPKMLRAQQRALGELDDLLGNEHDLSVLALRLTKHSREFDRKAVKSWLCLIAARQRELRREALWLGQRIFVTKPPVVEDCLSSWWNTARTKKSRSERSHEPWRI